MKFMELLKKSLQEMLDLAKKNIEMIKKEELSSWINNIASAPHIFVCGAGRSGLVAKAFGMRLSQLGLKAFVVGETTTPPVRKGDSLVAISSSGKTASILSIAHKAKSEGAKII